MKYVFGPVTSRRLGLSLGIDPLPFKTCNYSCVYCQLGRTSPTTEQRGDFHPPEDILAEVQAALAARSRADIDWITFVGSGEPTLHKGLGRMIRELKALTDIPLAVITNGSLLYLREVRQALLPADAVLPSLDAGTETLYRKINRPARRFTLRQLVNGLIDFRRAYTGKLWIEVMLLKGINDTPEALDKLAALLRRIAPDQVQVSLPTRPPTEPWVQPADRDGLRRATAVLGQVARVVLPVEGSFDLSGFENVVDAVVSIITRHPMPEKELIRALRRWTPHQVAQALRQLAADGRAQNVARYGQRFWTCAAARYTDPPQPAPPDGANPD